MAVNHKIEARLLWCAAFAILATAALSSAQTFTTLASFNGTGGSNPIPDLVQGIDGNLYGTTYGGGAFSQGIAFKITPSGTLTTIYSFCQQTSCTDGSAPYAGLVLATNGSFYGATTTGGTSNDGTVFAVNSAGALTTLHSFNNADGKSPGASLMQASDGSLFGTTELGGSSTAGTVFKITTAGAFTSLHSFTLAAGNVPTDRLFQAANGKLYGTTGDGGTSTLGTVFSITATGTLTTLANFDGTDGGYPFGGLIQASNGNFYGTTLHNGASGAGEVFEMTPAGKITTLHSFCALAGCTDGSYPWDNLIQAPDGNLYGTTRSGGTYDGGTIFKITTTGTLTTLHSFCAQTACADGLGPIAGLVEATDGNFYGTTYSGGTSNLGTVFRFSVGLKPFVKLLPTSGRVGTKVIILGSSLAGATAVTFNGTKATFTVVSKTHITATVPAGATAGVVKVSTPTGTLSSNLNFRVTPQLTSFTPASGSVGTTVTITGMSLSKTTKVTFGGVAATTFTVKSDTQVTVAVPTGAKTGKIGITTSGGTATSATIFTVT